MSGMSASPTFAFTFTSQHSLNIKVMAIWIFEITDRPIWGWGSFFHNSIHSFPSFTLSVLMTFSSVTQIVGFSLLLMIPCITSASARSRRKAFIPAMVWSALLKFRI